MFMFMFMLSCCVVTFGFCHKRENGKKVDEEFVRWWCFGWTTAAATTIEWKQNETGP